MEVAKRRANIVLQIEWVIFAIEAVLGMIFAIGYYYLSKDSNLDSETIYQRGSMTSYRTRVTSRYSGIYLVIGVVVLIPLLLNILLTVGIRKEKRSCCIVWYIIAILGALLHVLIFVMILLSGEITAIGIEGVWLAYKFYAVIIIIDFTSELELHKNSTPGVMYMAPGVINAAPPPGQAPGAGFISGNPNPPQYDDAAKITLPWDNSPNPDYPGAVGV